MWCDDRRIGGDCTVVLVLVEIVVRFLGLVSAYYVLQVELIITKGFSL